MAHPRRGAALIAGGGTAGHLVPGLATAGALVEAGWPHDLVHFVGSARGVEREMVPAAGFGVSLLPGRGINERRLNLANLRNAIDLVRGILRGVWLVVRRRPAVVLSLGGYAALPASVGAVIGRVPLVVAEQNAVPSSTNRFLGRFARHCAVPFEGVDLPQAVVTGNPVRAEVVEAADTDGRSEWPSDRPRVVIFGGSLGSLRINRAVWDAAPTLVADGVFIYHVVGSRDWGERPDLALPETQYRAVEYDHDLPSALAGADLVVSRSGGSTVAELAVIGVAAVLIPLPIATHDHQRANAAELERVGAARVVADADLDADRLVSEIRRSIGEGVTTSAEAARTVGYPDAAARVARLLMRTARRVPPGVDVLPPE